MGNSSVAKSPDLSPTETNKTFIKLLELKLKVYTYFTYWLIYSPLWWRAEAKTTSLHCTCMSPSPKTGGRCKDSNTGRPKWSLKVRFLLLYWCKHKLPLLALCQHHKLRIKNDFAGAFRGLCRGFLWIQLLSAWSQDQWMDPAVGSFRVWQYEFLRKSFQRLKNHLGECLLSFPLTSHLSHMLTHNALFQLFSSETR